MDAFGPLQQAHRLTFAAEAAEAAAAGAPATEPAIAEAATGEAAPTADALAAWDAATQAWDGLSQPYPLARSLLRAAQAAIDRGDRDRAAERLARAAPLAEALGAGPLREQILAKLSAGSRTEAAAIALREGLAAAGP